MGFVVLFDKPARVQRHVSMRVPVHGGTQMVSVPGEQVKGRVTWPPSQCLPPNTRCVIDGGGQWNMHDEG